MRSLLSKSLVAVSLLCGATGALAQNLVDADVVGKADAIMAKLPSAKGSDLPGLLAQFAPLIGAAGLSKPCQTLLISMHGAASMTMPAGDDDDDMPEEMKKANPQAAALGKTIEAQRAACLQAAKPERKEAAPARTAPAADSASAEERIANDAGVAIRDRLASLRDKAKSAYLAADQAALARVGTVLGTIGKDKDHDIDCRLAATAMARELKGYVNALEAKDADSKKIAEAGIRVAAGSADRALGKCE